MQVGLGTHIPEVIEYAEDKGWDVDFYMACFYNLSRKPRESALVPASYRRRRVPRTTTRPRCAEVIRQTPKTCLAFKILAASRLAARQECVREAFRYRFRSASSRRTPSSSACSPSVKTRSR